MGLLQLQSVETHDPSLAQFFTVSGTENTNVMAASGPENAGPPFQHLFSLKMRANLMAVSFIGPKLISDDVSQRVNKLLPIFEVAFSEF